MNCYQPRNFMILPTMSCQGRCLYCFGPNKGPVMDEETADKTVEFISRIAPQRGTVHVTFHGGEPLLVPLSWYQRILPMLRECFGRRLRLSIQSNLLALSDEMISIIEEYEISVGTSVDGFEEMCDAQRGKGYYKKNAEARNRLDESGISLGEICTFTPKYIDHESVKRVFRSFRTPFSIHGSVPCLGQAPTEHNLTVEQLGSLLLTGYEVYRDNISINRISTIDNMAKGCFEERGCICTFFDCLGVFAAIASDGGVYSCQRFCGHEEFCFGNVNESITENTILCSSAYQRLRQQQDGTMTACDNCCHFAYCKGGCLYNALTAGTPKDPYCEAYRSTFDRLSLDMAQEMGYVLLGQRKVTPVLSMAGDRSHPYEIKCNERRLKRAVEAGKKNEKMMPVRRSVVHPENHLNKLYLHLTFNCPLSCPHCYAYGGERKSDELTAGQLIKIIYEAVEARFRAIVLTGGEPLVYEEFDELINELETVDRKGTRLILRSSFGFPISDERMKRICSVFDEIVVSVDGDEHSHNARRGAGRYEVTVSNLEKAAEAGWADKLGLCATMEHAMCEGTEGKSVKLLAEKLHITKVRFRPVLPLGRGSGAKQENYRFCAEEELRFEKFRPVFSCGMGQNLYVEPNGDSYPCYTWCEKENCLGNLGEISLQELLKKGELFEYCQHDVDSNEKCKTCEVRYLCGGLCKAWAADKHNIDSGSFDCTERKAYFLDMAERINRY